MLRLAIVSVVIALIAAFSGFGTVASYSRAGTTILLFVFLVLIMLSFLTYEFTATITSNRLRPIHWQGRSTPRSRLPQGVSHERNKPIASSVRARSEQAVASGTNMSSPSTGASLCATATTHTTSGTWSPPLCWRHSKPHNPIR